MGERSTWKIPSYSNKKLEIPAASATERNLIRRACGRRRFLDAKYPTVEKSYSIFYIKCHSVSPWILYSLSTKIKFVFFSWDSILNSRERETFITLMLKLPAARNVIFPFQQKKSADPACDADVWYSRWRWWWTRRLAVINETKYINIYIKTTVITWTKGAAAPRRRYVEREYT